MALAPGTVIDRYIVEGPLGEGGMAVVYLVRHAQLGSLHALKVLSLPMPSLRGRFMQEGRLQASLRHTNVVSVTDIIDVEGVPGLIMEYIEGPNLEVFLRQGRVPVEEADALAAGITAGVAAVHKLGLVHRDLKPANVLLFRGDHGFIPKVADFGLARLLSGDEAPGGMRRTRAGVCMGTPSYMAPEQTRDAKGVDKRADIFSLGAILYEIYCGTQAFFGDDLVSVFTAIRTGVFVPPRHHAPDLPSRIVLAIEGALQVSADDRFPDCETLMVTLRGGENSPVGRPAAGAGLTQDLGTSPIDPSAVEEDGPGASRISAHTFHATTIAPDAPPADAAEGYRVVRQGHLCIQRSDVRCGISAEADVFVGREDDLAALARVLDVGARLVTLLGGGGAGKTRLARRFALARLRDFPGGVYFCDLADARDLQGVVAAVARGLDVPLGNDDPVRQLGHAIAGRGACLVLLDNFEQVVIHAAATVGRWLDRAGSAIFLVTSQERLSVAGEHVQAVAPLPNDDAVRLFEARARLQQPEFAVTAANRADVVAIAATLDGLPLAIELAAARIRILAPHQLRERLKERFKVLAGRSGSLRQGTLRAAIDWSWGLLAPWEKGGLAQLSAFEGGFTLSAAELVLDLGAEAPLGMDVVQALVDKSLLRVEQDRRDLGEPWFGMYRSVLEYSAEKLRTPGAYPGSGPQDEAATWKRHGDCFAAMGTEEAIEALDTGVGPQRRRALAAGIDNLVQACKRAIQREDGPVAAAICRAAWPVWAMRGPSSVAAQLAEAVLAMRSLDAAARARTARVAGLALRMSGNAAGAEAHLLASRLLLEAAGDRAGEAVVLGNLGLLHMERGEMTLARSEQEAALAIQRSTSRKGYGVALGNLAILNRRQGRMEEARAQYEQALQIHREVGNRRDEGVVLGNLGLLGADQDRLEEARSHYEQALACHREIGNQRGEGVMLGNLGDLLLGLDRFDEALSHYEQALSIHREIGNRRFEGVMLGSIGLVHTRRGDHTSAEARFADGELVLRSIGDQLELGRLLGARAEGHHRSGDAVAARTSLAEAEGLAAAVGATPSTELGRMLARVQALIR